MTPSSNPLLQVHEDAKALRALISDESRWTKQVYARDIDGNDCSQFSDEAVCWCLTGAVDRVLGLSRGQWAEAESYFIRRRALIQALEKIGVKRVVHFNDDASWRQVDEALTNLVLSTTWRDSPTSC